jgi:hypothetical protein
MTSALGVSENNKKLRSFVAYPSQPADRTESIEQAIEEIRSGGVVDIAGWKDLAIGGRVVISTICDKIKESDIFVADVTGLNPNVLFELGYAIAHRKRIWLLLNTHIAKAHDDFNRFQLLTTIGYAPYSNSADIVKRFYSDEPYKTPGDNLRDELLRAAGPPSIKDALLYLRADIQTDASIRVARRVSSGPIRSVIDDPQEVRHQALSWYVQQVAASFGVVCHLLSAEYRDYELHNAKHSLVAGLAHGSAKPLLMLAHEPYSSPLDYRDLLRPHRTAAIAESIFAEWSLPLIEQYEKRISSAASYREAERARRELVDITVGEPVAEYESDSLPEYFVPTAVFTEVLKAKYSLIVGRKGTGKTATLLAVHEEFLADPRNHVCAIRPLGYELEGLLYVLEHELPRAEKGYLVESFWKFLLYTELAKSVYDQLLRKPEYYVRTPAEAALSEFVEQQRSLITPEFTIRLETAVRTLTGLMTSSGKGGTRVRISELFHDEMLGRLRILLGRALEHKAKVVILVDNLDKAWNPKADLPLLSELLFGLLSVSRRVAEEFERDASGRSPVNLAFVLFLRSDIYAAILQFAKERDKLPAHLITWRDSELLRRVIEERFLKSADIEFPYEVWQRYFPPNVQGTPTWEYIGARILPRPRDLIYLVKAALQLAINRGNTQVGEKDLVDAETQYSRFALDSLIVESAVRIPNVENLLVHFVQSNRIVTEQEIAEKLHAAAIPPDQFESVTSLFVQLTFLGLEVEQNRFEFLDNEQDALKLSVMAAKTTEATKVRRFQIHPAFHAYLEIRTPASAVTGQLPIGI